MEDVTTLMEGNQTLTTNWTTHTLNACKVWASLLVVEYTNKTLACYIEVKMWVWVARLPSLKL
jgi:hypothetical protein